MSDTGSNEAIRAEAREWLLRQALDGVSLEHNEAFQRWYRASEQHAQAFADVERTWADAASMQDLRPLVEAGPPVSRTSWHVRALATSVVLAMVVGLIAWTLQRPQIYATRIGEVREITLSDGSVLTLGGKTTVAVKLGSSRRDAELRVGEVFLSVHPDKERPFHVTAGETGVRVVGTQFDVRRGTSQVEIGVLEGTVEVRGERQPLAAKLVHGGQQLTASQGVLGEPQASGAMQPGAWRQGRRVYVDTPLREIVADANRYSRQPIELADAALGELKVSVSFRAENQQQMFNSLQLALPLTVERAQPDRIVLRAAP